MIHYNKYYRFQRGFPEAPETPPRYAPEVGTSEGDFHASPKKDFKVQYFKALDLVTNFIHQGFDQPGYKVYQSLQDLLITEKIFHKIWKQ